MHPGGTALIVVGSHILQVKGLNPGIPPPTSATAV